MKVLVLSEKGGVGKSFVSANVVAPALFLLDGEQKQKLLEIDSVNFTSAVLKKTQILDIEQISIRKKAEEVQKSKTALLDELKSGKQNGGGDINKDIYGEMEKVISRMMSEGVNVVDVGANLVIEFLEIMRVKKLMGYFDYIFVVSDTNANDVALAQKTFKYIAGFYDSKRMCYVINRYNDAFESTLQKFNITDCVIRIHEVDYYSEKIFKQQMTLFDIVLSYDEAEIRQQIDEALRSGDVGTAERLGEKLMFLEIAHRFYRSAGFRVVLDVLGGVRV